jgi:hypothetical protein
MDDDRLNERPDAPADRHPYPRSYFTRKLEERLREKDVEIPRDLYDLMDKPFDDFSEEDREVYDNRFRALTHVFLEALDEVYISMGTPYQGWDERSDRLGPTPIKVLAKLVLTEEERLQVMAEEAIARVMRDTPPAGTPAGQKERWWNRKTPWGTPRDKDKGE